MEEATKTESPTGKGAGYTQRIEQNKGNVSRDEKQTMKPSFEPLKNPETLQDINPFSNQEQEPPAKVSVIFEELLEDFIPLDFEALAFPQIEQLREEAEKLEILCKNPDGSYNTEGQKTEWEKLKSINKQIERFKITEKHLLILTIENVKKQAELNEWGICKSAGFVYLFNGAYWVKVEEETLQSFLGMAAEKMGVAKFSARFFDFRAKLLKQFFAVSYLPTPEPPENKALLNLKNGTLEVTPEGNKLRPFNREDFLRYQLPFEYNPEAKAPQFKAFLQRVLPDPEAQKVLSEFLGYVFVKTEHLKLEKALLLYGTGANGKSVVFDIVNALFGGENITSFSLEDLTDKSGYSRAEIEGKLLNYASEINGKLETSIMKQIISGEQVAARVIYRRPFSIKDYAKLIFNLNELPREVEHTNAFFRRLLILPFNVTIPEKEQDKQLAKKIIKTELSGVFNWVLEGLERLLLNKGFTDCEAIEQAREDYKTNTDTVKLFIIENNYGQSTTETMLLKDLYLNYRTFCKEDEFAIPVKKQNFRKRLEGMGFVIEKMNTGNNVFIETTETPF